MEQLGQWIQLIISSATLIGLFVAVYKFSRDPDEKMEKKIIAREIICDEKHKRLDEIVGEMRNKFTSIDKSLTLIKENDIKHIENNIRGIKETQVKILTILEYKESAKFFKKGG